MRRSLDELPFPVSALIDSGNGVHAYVFLTDPLDPDSWLFIEEGTVWRDFDAVIRLGERAGGLGRLCSVLRLVPRPLRDWLYQRIARNRYAMFGRGDMCALPDPAFRARLLP